MRSGRSGGTGPDGIVIGDTDRFIMGYQIAELRAGGRAPAMDAGDRAGAVQPDCGLRPGAVTTGVLGKPCLMCAPAQFGRLEPFGDETFD